MRYFLRIADKCLLPYFFSPREQDLQVLNVKIAISHSYNKNIEKFIFYAPHIQRTGWGNTARIFKKLIITVKRAGLWITLFSHPSRKRYDLNTMQESSKKPILIAIAAAALILALAAYFFIKKSSAPEEKNITETAKEISESVPEIQTNPGEDVPEINPLDLANPFKYKNPLR